MNAPTDTKPDHVAAHRGARLWLTWSEETAEPGDDVDIDNLASAYLELETERDNGSHPLILWAVLAVIFVSLAVRWWPS